MKRLVGIILFMLPFSLCGHTAEKNCDDIFILKSHKQMKNKGEQSPSDRKKVSVFSPKGYNFDYGLFISNLYYDIFDKDEYHVETLQFRYEDEQEVKIKNILPLSKSKEFIAKGYDGKNYSKNYQFSAFIYRYYGINKLYYITSVKEIDQQVAKKVEACENRTLGYVRRVK